MEYKVIPFLPSINQKKENSSHVAQQLEEIINGGNQPGWKFISLEEVSTFVQPNSGCFGFGASPGYTTFRQIVVFTKI